MSRAGAVTGIGLVTPVGRKPGEVFDALCVGRTGIVTPPEGHPLAGLVEAAGIGPEVDAAEVLPARESLAVDRFVLYAVAAADDALADARITVGTDVDPERVAVVVSTGGAGLETYDRYARLRAGGGRAKVTPYLLPGMLANMAAARIAIKHGVRGHSACLATACAAGAQSIAEALRLLRSGDADVVVCGGVDTPLHPTVAAAFGNARALARGWAEDPGRSSRPFDRRRNGFVLAEGAGVLVVERPEFADARGAAAYAGLLGWGVTTDAHHPTTPRPDGAGAAAVMRRALADADLRPSDVDHVNAHGTSTPLGDAAEALALRAVFGDDGPAVSSIKALTGHMLGGSGAVEAAATALSIAEGVLPPTHHLDDPDPACPLDHVRGAPRTGAVRAALSNSFAFGGHNVSLLLGAPTTTRTRTTAPTPD
ncbi:beta-ketoacyl-[acyl-carrier-protein] synthase family protein [Actinokineospora spheciospongiae]|uniref:beta-ketoacyl-[acyl-carrier-protein] synthase family protein n=1 Tax=Actinokineospora spheciospongiae TaxID=909613 RepID=UPI000D709BB0|nr:beta-ketoacyl-[acyl-carrier-protein] synthase family protein [Actinokineospora spheciospongiae]PWW52669.1 3-oxoacyl-[acyl-carrier-protein] synthase II [Actinokineospora spheciospongiae]